MGLRDQQRTAQIERLTAAAWDLFEARGYEATTVEAIAHAAGVSVPTLFRYFPSKADLVTGRDEDRVDHVVAAIAEAARDEPLIAVLRRAVVTGGVEGASGSRIGALRTRLLAESDELRRRQLKIDDRAIRRAADAIGARIGATAPDPRPRAIAAALHAAVRAAMEAWQVEPRGRSLTEVLGAAIDALPEAFGLLRP